MSAKDTSSEKSALPDLEGLGQEGLDIQPIAPVPARSGKGHKKATEQTYQRIEELFFGLDEELTDPQSIHARWDDGELDLSVAYEPAADPIPPAPQRPSVPVPAITPPKPVEPPEEHFPASPAVFQDDGPESGAQVSDTSSWTQTGSEETNPIAWDSLNIRKPLATGSHTSSPGTLAYDPSQLQLAGDARLSIDPAASPSILMEILNEDPDRRWSEDELLLVEQVTDQLTLALENAQLFEQTQRARDALQISVRYQKCVAGAVAVLNERGVSAISDVLQLLGEASQASRVYYLETQVDHRGPFWRLISEWRLPGLSSQAANPALRELAGEALRPWLKRLEAEGYLAETASSASAETRSFLESLGVLSILQIPVAGGHEAPGCIAFELVDSERAWTAEEIAALQTSATALSNTIIRENLFSQLQVNLSETEAQYQASAQLNSASDASEILAILRQFTILGHMNATHISINTFDHPWTRFEKPDWLIQVNHWAAKHGPESFIERHPISQWRNVEALFNPDRPTLIFDLAGDPRVDPSARSLYVEGLGAKSLLSLPLNVSGRWIGQIIALYNQTTGFTEREIRRLVSLSSQAAVAFESLRLLDETRQRNEELLAMNQVTSAVSRTLELDQVLGEILQRVLAITEFDSGLISYVDPSSDQLVLAVQQNLPAAMIEQLNLKGLGGTPCDLVFQTGQTIFAPDISHLSGDMLALAGSLTPSWPHEGIAPAFAGLISLGFRSYLGVPLSVKGKPLGTVCMFSQQNKKVAPERIALTEAVGQQVGVAVENARLFQSTQIALDETEALYQASSELNAVQNYDDILDSLRRFTVLGEANQLLSIALFDHPWVIHGVKRRTGQLPSLSDAKRPEWMIPIAHWSSLPVESQLERYELEKFPAFRLLSPGQPTMIEDVANDERLDAAARQLFQESFQARGVIFAPLFIGDQWIGIIFGAYPTTVHFNEDQIRRVSSLSSQSAIAIQNIRLLEESRRRASQLQTAAEIARDTSSTLALDSLLQRTISLIAERFGFYHVSIFLVDETGSEAVVRESTGPAGEEMKLLGHRLAVGSRSVVGQVTETGQPLVLNDIHNEESRQIHHLNPLLPLTRAELGIPLKIGDRVIGALDVQSDIANAFSDDDVSVLQTLSDQIAVAVDNARSYEIAQTAVEEIREADRLKTQFLANMSHELRTPLNSIIGFSRVILKGIDGPINEQQTQDLTAIYNSGQHLLGLINDVLDLSRIEAGKMDLAYEPNVNVGDIIRSVMSTTMGLVKDKPIRLEQRIDPDLPLITADAMKIRQVLINLLSNAAKFTERGSITVEAARYNTSAGEPQVIIRVIDTGPGIAAQDQARLFQPFSQVDGSLTRKTGGSGLGLSISSHLIRLHNGQIGLQSEIDKGSAFYIILPVNQPENTSAASESLPEQTLDTQTDTFSTRQEHVTTLTGTGLEKNRPVIPGFTPLDGSNPASSPRLILAIEKDHQVIDLYKRYLDGHNCTVISLTRLEQAVTVARSVQPFAITLDIAMTGVEKPAGTGALIPSIIGTSGLLDGMKVLKELKKDPDTRHIPVIVCSMSAQQEKAFALGASDYLLKPILEDELVQAIHHLQQAAA